MAKRVLLLDADGSNPGDAEQLRELGYEVAIIGGADKVRAVNTEISLRERAALVAFQAILSNRPGVFPSSEAAADAWSHADEFVKAAPKDLLA